jgi:hypothetical protein
MSTTALIIRPGGIMIDQIDLILLQFAWSTVKSQILRIRASLGLTLLLLGLSLSISAQAPSPLPVKETPVERPNPTGTDPIHENATTAILKAFDHYEVVGIGAAHGNQNLDDLILDLVRDPAFPKQINDVVVECGNSLYQPLLDRYIAGEDVSLHEVRQVWRNTTQPMCGVSAFYEQLFPLMRRLNQRLSPNMRVRVLAGDPPIDWEKVTKPEDTYNFNRDKSIASVMEKEVLSKHRKAIMLFGTAHLFHGTMAMGIQSAVAQYEMNYPNVTLVIAEHRGFGSYTPFAKYSDELESRMDSWPSRSFVLKLKGTWLGNLLDETYSTGVQVHMKRTGKDGKTEFYNVPFENGHKFSTMADAYIYLGPRDLLLSEPPPANVFLDKEYMTEMARRALVTKQGPIYSQADPEKISQGDYGALMFDIDKNESGHPVQ